MSLKQKLKLNLLCFVGYFYFSFILFLMISLIAAGVILLIAVGKAAVIKLLFKLAIPIAALGCTIFRGFFKAVFLKLPEPDGISLNKTDYEHFYKIIDEVRLGAKCPKIHHIKLNLDINAYIAERPTFGILGWYRRYLVVGLPLLLMLSKQELTAVLAHECRHLSKAHGKKDVNLYRVKSIWESISEELKKEGKDRNFFVRGFMHWYIPALNEMLFSMKKEHEYEADRIAAAVSGKQAVATSLLKIYIYDYFLDKTFWQDIYKLNAEIAEPPEDLYFRMEKAIEKPLPYEYSNPLIESFLGQRSRPNSTHPSYIERIENLEADIPKIEALTASSLRSTFLNKAGKILDTASKRWSQNVFEGWKKYYLESNMELELCSAGKRYKMSC